MYVVCVLHGDGPIKIESTIVDKWCQETNDILHLKVSLLRVGRTSFP